MPDRNLMKANRLYTFGCQLTDRLTGQKFVSSQDVFTIGLSQPFISAFYESRINPTGFLKILSTN